jgi:ribosomal protein S18 acetylase RimI-like enzyme
VDGELTLRLATADDDADLLELDTGEAGTGFPSVFSRERSSFFGSATPSDTLVAEVDRSVVGYLTLTHPTRLPENAHVWAIEGFAVDPSWRRHGIGSALLDEAAREARRRGGRKLSLRVLSTNAGARTVYEAAGFQTEGVLRGEFVIDGVLVDDVVMAHPL